MVGVYGPDCVAPAGSDEQFDTGLNAKFSPMHSEFLHDVRQEKIAIGKLIQYILFLLCWNIKARLRE